MGGGFSRKEPDQAPTLEYRVVSQRPQQQVPSGNTAFPAHPAARNQESAKACCGGGGGWNKDVQGGTAPSTGGSWLEFCVAKINK